jgi:hypothetical protein
MTNGDCVYLSTTLDGIVNHINVLSNEVTHHTGILLIKLEEMTRERTVQTKERPVQKRNQSVQSCSRKCLSKGMHSSLVLLIL